MNVVCRIGDNIINCIVNGYTNILTISCSLHVHVGVQSGVYSSACLGGWS